LISRAGWLRTLLAYGGLLLLTATGRAQTAPTFNLIDSEITIDSGSGEGRGSLRLKADGLDAARLGQPLGYIKDLQSPLPHRSMSRSRRMSCRERTTAATGC
jgi:hypothetical protein